MKDPKTCDHPSFLANCQVHRLTEKEDGPIVGYQVDVTLKCVECDLPFRFRGVPAGNDPDVPRASADGLELRAPIEPAYTVKLSDSATYRLPFGKKVTLQ